MNRTRTPKALHPSVIVVNGTAIDTLTNRCLTECDRASASEWEAVLTEVSRRRWIQDMNHSPALRAQRVPRNWV